MRDDRSTSGYLEGNLDVLERRFPELAELLKNTVPVGLEILETPRGRPTARIQGLLLHSRYDPEAEARRAAAAHAASGADTLVLLGLGLGYAAEAALEEAPSARIVVAEADPALLAACLDIRDLRGPLSDERLSILAGGEPEGLLWAFERLETRKVRVMETKAELEIYADWYGRAKAVLSRFEAKESINANTLRRFGKLWVRNLSRNLDEIPRRPGVASLEDAFSGLPGIVIAAGPSLDDVLPRAREIRGRAVVVCVDTALRSLLREGVEPDFLVVVDPQYWNARHLDRCKSPSSILITEGAVWPSVLRMPFAAVRLCASLYPLGEFAERRAGAPKGRLGAGGSVATTAWDFARSLGCRPVYMAGLDLGFPGGHTHARASRFEQKALSESRRLRPSVTERYATYLSGQPYDAQANDGSKVRTDKRLSLYSWWFESRMRKYPECRTVNLSPGGLAVPGMPYEPLENVLELPERRKEIDERLEAIRNDKGIRKEDTPVPDVRAQVLNLLSEMETRSAAALELTARARETARRGKDPSSLLKRLDEEDGRLLGNDAKEIAGFLMPALEEILGRPARTFEEALDRSAAVYREIRDSAALHRRILSRGRTD